MKTVYVITHPDVVIDPNVPVPNWPLSVKGRQRMENLLDEPWLKTITAVYSSDERKALDGAMILADQLGLTVIQQAGLEEVDRSSTGYLPVEQHDFNAELLFKHPADSVDGWETAEHAQKRMVAAVDQLIQADQTAGSLVIVTHGAVGSFLMSHLRKASITIADSPNVSGGGGIFSFDSETKTVLSDWQNIDNAQF
ncbi:MAG: histidine phosphatase family protein [Anaerolineae bacterium]